LTKFNALFSFASYSTKEKVNQMNISIISFVFTFNVVLEHSDRSYHQFFFKVFNVPSSLISNIAILIASLKKKQDFSRMSALEKKSHNYLNSEPTGVAIP